MRTAYFAPFFLPKKEVKWWENGSKLAAVILIGLRSFRVTRGFLSGNCCRYLSGAYQVRPITRRKYPHPSYRHQIEGPMTVCLRSMSRKTSRRMILLSFQLRVLKSFESTRNLVVLRVFKKRFLAYKAKNSCCNIIIEGKKSEKSIGWRVTRGFQVRVR